MTNQERDDMTPEQARDILSLLDDDTVIGQADAQWAVETIANAGLLMPDLPEPVKNYESVFRVASPLLDCRSVQAVGGQVAIHGYKSRHAPIEEARRFAYALLAAAKLVEEQE